MPIDPNGATAMGCWSGALTLSGPWSLPLDTWGQHQLASKAPGSIAPIHPQQSQPATALAEAAESAPG